MDAGSIVHIDYDLYDAGSERLIETTREDVAKENDILKWNISYRTRSYQTSNQKLKSGCRSITKGTRL